MDLQQIFVTIHLFGFALGLGGATIGDIVFIKSLRRNNLSEEVFGFFKTTSRIIWIGLGLLIISGLSIFTLIYLEQGSLSLLASSRWQTKLILVAIVTLNGLFFKLAIFSILKNLIHQPLSVQNISPIIWKLAISGTISLVSWYSIFILSLLPRTFRPQILIIIGVYVFALICGAIISKSILFNLAKKNSH